MRLHGLMRTLENRTSRIRQFCTAALLSLVLLVSSAAASASNDIRSELMRRVGPTDAVILVDPQGGVIAEKNADRLLVPASILKLLTSLVALDSLGPGFRYTTEFYLDDQGSLTVKGYGDPLLISEVVADIAAELARKLSAPATLDHLRLDETHFIRPLTIPGVSASSQPYDAPNGALCVNFNTVNFKRDQGRYVSAEPQTPLLPFALEKIHSRSAKGGRVVLSRVKKENTLYAGKLFEYFLEKEGLKFNREAKIGAAASTDRLVLSYRSPYALTEIVAKLLEHSNNFITNQLLISAGVSTYGAPGALDKGVQAARVYAADRLGIKIPFLVEGSGISRKNRISARQMQRVLQHFDPYHHLMRREENEFYKTGTMSGISTRAGYLVDSKGRRYPFVIMRNTPGQTAPTLMPYLKMIVHEIENK